MSRLGLLVARNTRTARFLAVTVGFVLAIAGSGIAFAADPSFP